MNSLQKIVEQYRSYKDQKIEDQPDFGPPGKTADPYLNLLYEAYNAGVAKGIDLKDSPELEFNLGMCFISDNELKKGGPFMKTSEVLSRPLVIKANLIHVFPDKPGFWTRLGLARIFFKRLKEFYK